MITFIVVASLVTAGILLRKKIVDFVQKKLFKE